jgi:plasmid segregation protein ParM
MDAGIDIGYSSVKAISGDRRTIFQSVIGTPERSRFSLHDNSNDGLVLNDTGGTWLVGDAAVTQSRFVSRREDATWYLGDEYRRLMLAAFARLTTGTAVKLNVVTGLPVAYYTTGKDELQALFLGRHKVEIEGRTPQQIEVEQCRVIPQPFGAALSVALTDGGKMADRTMAEGPVGVIDVGGKTTNLLSVRGLSDVARETTSVNIGAWDAVRSVRDYLTETYPGLDLRDHDLITVIQTRELYFFGERIDLSGQVDDILHKMAQTVIAAATQLWNGGGTMRAILVAGGGAYLLGNHLRQAFRHIRIVENPQFANAVGYYKFARLLAGRS